MRTNFLPGIDDIKQKIVINRPLVKINNKFNINISVILEKIRKYLDSIEKIFLILQSYFKVSLRQKAFSAQKTEIHVSCESLF